mgnify:CR=1 FL=1
MVIKYMRTILGIIPARGGSKSIPRKNIKSFCGKPLIAWKIEAAIQSGVFDRIIVSTDDAEIAEVARRHGAEVPFMRPAELAEDTTPTLFVVQHALTWLRDKENYQSDVVVLLEPTTPAVQPFHIREMIEILAKTGADSVVSVIDVPTAYNPHWQFVMAEDTRLSLFTGASIRQIIQRRQDLPKTYHRNSALYVFKPGLIFANEPSFYGEDVRGYVMGRAYSSDIDTPEDWGEAEENMRILLERNRHYLP